LLSLAACRFTPVFFDVNNFFKSSLAACLSFNLGFLFDEAASLDVFEILPPLCLE